MPSGSLGPETASTSTVSVPEPQSTMFLGSQSATSMVPLQVRVERLGESLLIVSMSPRP